MINSSVSVDQISKGVGLTVFIPFADGVYMPVIKNCENFNNNGLQKYNELESTMGKIEAIYNENLKKEVSINNKRVEKMD